ncbi:GT2 family glycosyltransferase [Sporomusaceae bacterium BoRhaA]|uniref:glycosyltransferase family 2 protein n=1 Tax=Pelorhabdus rhamnosifermentans TaxID=2772457 RepID=UPI001C064160|nr:glycosyltransferase family 2 protein [Pelorhabdus rhamnosifermentans]MBU2699027.1 GT2 family glycosyltransferase [Pelorhabdus rhamnosifermentans]
MMNNSVMVSVIIVTFNGLDHLKECLPPLQMQTYPKDKFEVIVVDNGSSDGTIQYLKENYSNIVVIENRNNEGFAKPNNQAANVAKGKFLALLNNDMVVKEDWIEQLLATQTRTGAEGVAGMILNRDKSIEYSEGKIDCYGYSYHFHDRVAEEKEVFYACGGSLLINRNIYLSVGGLDEDFYLYYEDTDLCWRLWLLGYRVVFSPKAQSIHKHSATAGTFSRLQIDLYAERNHLCMLYKNYDEHHVYKFLFGAIMLRFLKIMEILRIDNLSEEKIILKPLSFTERVKKLITYSKIIVRLLRKMDRLVTQILTIASFLYLFPVMRKKRQELQMQRKRTDVEIMEKFHVNSSYFIRSQYKVLDKYIESWRTQG